MINIDSLRADHMGIYGYSKNTTPFLDSLFNQGVIFNNAITPGFLTFQTDAAIFSGLYPSQNNVKEWDTPINPKLTLLPKVLSLYGYKTAAFVSPSLWEEFGFAKQFDVYRLNDNVKNIKESKEYVADWMKNEKEPFFAFWHVYDVHSPYIKPSFEFYKKEYEGIFLSDVNWDWAAQTVDKICHYPAATTNICNKINSYELEYLKAGYDTGIKYVDNELNQFFDSIKNENFYKNTVFIISSEHGEDLDEHGFVFHRDLYDVNVRVPLAIIAPGLSSQKIETAVSSLDIMPTIINIVGGMIPQNIEGKSLIPLIAGTKDEKDIFTERAPYNEYSIRRDNWKYILRNPNKKGNYDNFMLRMVKSDITKGDELYDLKNDPGEKNNLIGKGLEIEKTLKSEVLKFADKMAIAREYNKNIANVPSAVGPLIPYP